MPTYARYSGVGGGGGIQSINNSVLPAQQIVAGAGISVGTVIGTGITTITNTSPMAATGNLTEATSAVLTISGGTGCVIGSGTTIQVLQSSALQSGYLSSGDWSTFNNKVSSVGASAPISSTGGTTPSISISQSSALTDGYLSSTDWNTFNNKQNALSFGNLTGDTNANISISGGTGAVIGSGASVSQSAASTTANGYLSSTDWNTFNNKANSTLNNLTSPTAINQSLLFNPDATYDIGADGASRPAAIHASNHVTAPTFRGRDDVGSAGQHDITVRGGNATTGNKNGGILTLAGGTRSGSGSQGYIVISTAGLERARVLGDGTIGIGTSTPTSPLEIEKQGSVVVLPMLSINKFDNGGLGILGATIQAKTARGTATAPSAVVTSDELLSLKMSAYDSSTYQTYDVIKSVASATWNGSQNPFRTIFYSAENTTAKQRLSIEPNGELQIKGDTSGYVGISSPAAPTSYSLVLPTAQGAASSVLQNDGSGNLSWAVANLPSQTGNSGKFLITDGTNASWDSVVNEGGLSTIDFRVEGDTDANLLFTDASADSVGIGTNAPTGKLAVKGELRLFGSTSGYVGIQSPAAPTSYTTTMPGAQGAAGSYLQNNGSGTLAWSSANYQLSSSSSNFTYSGTAFSAVTNLSVTITTTGRPVVLMIVADGSANDCLLGVVSDGITGIGASVVFSFVRGATRLSQQQIASTDYLDGSAQIGKIYATVSPFLDTPSAGTYTYTVEVRTTSATRTAHAQYAKLLAYEI